MINKGIMDQEIHEKSIVYFNSNNKVQGNHSNGKMVVNNHLLKVKKIGVKSIKMYNSFYNITSLNNTIGFNENGTLNALTIAVGNYTLTEVLNLVKTEINAVAVDTWDWAFNVNTGKVTWASTLSTTGAFIIDATSKESVIYGLATDLGHKTQAGQAHPVVSDSLPDIDISEVLVEMKGLNNVHTHNKYLKSVLYTVPISTVGFGSMFSAEHSNIYFHDLSKDGSNIHDITYSLRDTNHNVLDNHGVPWSMELVCLHQ